MPGSRYFIAGGAGFIGSHFIDRLLGDPAIVKVTIYDNFSSGTEKHYAHHREDPRLVVVRGEIADLPKLALSMAGHDTVIHLASNPDIAKANEQPDIDFWQGTLLTQNVLEAMRRAGVRRILYASGSGVYGDLNTQELFEDHGPLEPISTYGASKLAGEAMISSYCHMFEFTARVFRFANVVGPRQTHGVGFDFVRALLKDPTSLKILGDGTQDKSYIHVTDVISAVLLADEKAQGRFAVFNVSSVDTVMVREIADIAVKCVGLAPGSVRYDFKGGNRGWKGDVPIVRINADKIKRLGWSCARTSRQAITDSILAMLDELRAQSLQKKAS